jgi:hypothetical protein
MDYKDRLDLFKHELKLMLKKDVIDFTKECLRVAPDYVFDDCPSSSSGKFHPIDELAGDGTVIHTKRVFTIAYDYTRAFGCEHHRDEVCAAALLHDMAKQGLESVGHTVRDHPQIMAKLIADVYNNGFKDRLDKNSANIIYWSVFYHYGEWTIPKYRKPIPEYSMEELAVYSADYIASKRFIEVDHIRKEGLST